MTTTPKPLLLRPDGHDADPRTLAAPQALELASRNAYPLVAQAGRRSDSLGLVVGAVAALALGGVTFWSMSRHRATPPAPVVAPPPPAPARLLATPAPAPQPVAAPPATKPATNSLASVSAPAMVYDTSEAPSTGPSTATGHETAPKAGAGKPISGGGTPDDDFALRVGGSAQVVSAEKMVNPSETVPESTMISAVLETAIDTDLPGYVRAIVTHDVHSFDGSRVLIPRMSRLIGQYKSGLAAGQTRAQVIWTRLIRPDGVSIALGSPGVDFSGNSGLAGKVNSHFVQRFGSAVLLSVVGGLSAVGNASVVVSGGQSAATVAAQRDAQIAPTVRVPQGTAIRVYVARDLDFSTVE